jgi:phosphatidylglycerophosphatase A
VGLFLLLLQTGAWWSLLTGVGLALALAIWLSGKAERILQKTDPSSVVIDEIAAMPICFLPWLVAAGFRTSSLPPAGYFFEGRQAWLLPAGFLLFRLFDVWKPWPVRQLQWLPGGWGVTVDDVAAALYSGLFLAVGAGLLAAAPMQ